MVYGIRSFALVLLLCVGPVCVPAYGGAPTTSTSEHTEFAVEFRELEELLANSQYDEVIERGQQLVDKYRVTYREGSVAEAEFLDLMVNACYRSDHVMEDRALAMAQRALQLKEALLGTDSAEFSTSLAHLANLYTRRGESRQAIPHFERAIAILAHAGPETDPARAVLLSSLGVAFRRIGDFEQALDLYMQALNLQESLLGLDHPDLAVTLNNLAIVQVQRGSYRDAQRLHERALAIRESHFGPDHEWTGESLNNLASVLSYLGQFDESQRAQERATAIFAEKLGRNHQRYWWANLNLALGYLDMGDHQGALPICEEVLAAIDARYGPQHSEMTYALDALASCHFKAGRFSKALELYTKSRQVGEVAFGVGNSETAHTIEQQGHCLVELGRLTEAAQILQNSLTIREGSVGDVSPNLCTLLHRLAELHLRLGEFDLAQVYTTRSRTILSRSLGEDHPLLAEALLLEARVNRALGQETMALQHALRAETISRRHLQITMRVLSENRALDYATTRTVGLDLALSLLPPIEKGERVGQIWNAVIRSRAAVLDEYCARNRDLSQHTGPRVQVLADSSLALRERLANLTLRGPGWEDVPTYRQLLDSARTELDRIERQLSEASASFRQAREYQRIGLAEVRAGLPERSSLLSFVRYQKSSGTRKQQQANTAYKVLLLTDKQAEPVAVELGMAAEIDELVSAWRDQICYGTRDAINPAKTEGSISTGRGFIRVPQDLPGRLATYRAVAEDLRRRIWDPLDPYLAESEQIFLVLDGSLHLVNFAALPVGDEHFLVENGLLLHTLVTERSLSDHGHQERPVGGLLAVGNPDYGPGSSLSTNQTALASDKQFAVSNLTLADIHFEPLPHAQREVAHIHDMWKRLKKPPASQAIILLGEAATEDAIKQNLPGKQVLHLATHGFVLAGANQPDGARVDRWSNPLVQSGLALAHANVWQQVPAGGRDGILTAEEVSALDLTEVEWAVLSACDTGLGTTAARGEGVFGLRRAFTLAGARTVIMSLWSVDDESTHEWMTALYDAHWHNQSNTAEAVQAATLSALASRRVSGQSVHPYYWAGFVAAGDWH